MATETVIKTITIRGTAEGVESLTQKVTALATSMDGVTAATDRQAKATLSVEASYKRLQSRYDEAFRAQTALAQVQKTLSAAQAQGLVTQERANELMQQAVIFHNKTGDAQARMTDTTKLARFELINLSRQIQDVGVSLASGQAATTVFIQQGTQIADVFASSQATLKGFASQVAGFLTSIFTPARVAIGGLLGIGAAAVAATVQWLDAQRQIQLALLGIGRASGLTVKDINEIADATKSLTGLSASQATQVATTLAGTGKIDLTSIKEAVPLAKDFAQLLGTSVPDAAKEMAKALADPAKGVEDLNAILGEFDAKTVETIKSLQAQGDRFGAQRLLIEGMKSGLVGVNETLSDTAKGWTAFGNIVSNIWTSLGQLFARGLGLEKTLSLEAQLEALNKQKELLSQPGADLLFSDTEFSSTQKKLDDVQKSIDQITRALQAQQGAAARTAANLRSIEVQKAVETALPEVGQQRTLENQLRLLQSERDALKANEVETADWQSRMNTINQAIGETVRQLGLVKSAQEKINDDIAIGTAAAKARTVEDRAQVEFSRSRVQAGESEADASKRAQIVRIQAATAEKQANDEAFLAGKQAIETRMTENALIGKSAGFQAEARANLQEQHRLEQVALKDQGDASKIDMEQLNTIKEQNKELKTQVDLGALRVVQHDLARETKFLQLTDQERQIAEKLRPAYENIDDALKSSEASQARFNARVKEAGDLAGTFLNDFVQGMLQGVSATEALGKALENLGRSITQSAFKDLGKTLTGSLTSGLSSILGTGFGAIGGPLAGAAVGVGISLIGQLFSSDAAKKQQDELKKLDDASKQAADALAGVVKSFNDLVAVASGPVTTAIKNAQTQFAQLVTSAQASQFAAIASFFGEGATAAQQASAIQAFQAAFNAIGLAGTQLNEFNLRTLQTALVALRGSDALTDVQQSMANLQKQAADLAEAYATLGIDSAAAAQVINENLNVALQRLTQQVAKDLTRQINTLTNRDWVNQVMDLIQTVKDATASMVDPGLVEQFRNVKAQDIVNQAELVGDAFNELLSIFPDLVGPIHEFNAAIEDTASTVARTADELQSASDALRVRFFQATQDQTTLENQLKLFNFQAQREIEAEVKAGGENLILLEQTLYVERLKLVKDFNDQLVADQKKAFQTILDYVNGLLTGSDSPLSPSGRLAQAQQLYGEQLALAQAGDVTALQNLTQFAESLRTAAQAFYGSSLGYQTIFGQIQSDLRGLTIAGGQYGGMVVGGVPGKDSVPLLAMPGEFLIRRSVAQIHGRSLAHLNQTGQMPANDNLIRIEHILMRILALTGEGNEALEINTQVIASQTDQLSRQERFTSRKMAG